MQPFSILLRQLRQQRGFSLGQLALQSGLGKATLSRWEAGTCLPRIPELNQVLDALDSPADIRAQCLRLLSVPRAILAERQESPNAMRLSLGNILYGLRQRCGKTQAEVSRSAGVSRSLYSQWENSGGLPSVEMLPVVGRALEASPQEMVSLSTGLSTGTFSANPMEKSREAVLDRYRESMAWDAENAPGTYQLALLALLANVTHLAKNGKADSADVALIVTRFGEYVETWDNDVVRRDRYFRRSLALAEQAKEPIHFHNVAALQCLLDSESSAIPVKERVKAALEWRYQFRDKAGQAYLLAFVARTIARYAPDEALRLADEYCQLVDDNEDEYPCRLRDRGNLLRRCGLAAESVRFLADLTPQDAYRSGLKQLDLAKGFIALNSRNEARNCIAQGRSILLPMNHAYTRTLIHDLERAVS